MQDLLKAAMDVMQISTNPDEVECEEIDITLTVPRSLMKLIDQITASNLIQGEFVDREAVINNLALQGVLRMLSEQTGPLKQKQETQAKPDADLSELFKSAGLDGFGDKFDKINDVMEQMNALKDQLEKLDPK